MSRKLEKVYGMKKCPFCGSDGTLIQFHTDGCSYSLDTMEFQPGCTSGEHKMDFVGTMEECIEYWNNRSI